MTDIAALVERLRELNGQTDAYANNRHHSFITIQQMARESAAATRDAADALEALQAELHEYDHVVQGEFKRAEFWRARAEKAEAENEQLRTGADTWLLEAITIWKHRAEAVEAGWKACALSNSQQRFRAALARAANAEAALNERA